MSEKPSWWPPNPYRGIGTVSADRDAYVWDKTADAMAEMMIVRIEYLANYLGAGFDLPAIEAETWEAFKGECGGCDEPAV